MKKTKRTKKIFGQESFKIAGDRVEAYVTRRAGHLAPIRFKLGKKTVEPMHVAPWWNEKVKGLPPILKVLRGDFFCLPFGGNETPYRGERHGVHGETANADWRFVRQDAEGLHLRLKTKIRPGQVDKLIRLVPGHRVVYQSHTISGMTGAMPLGHHATLRFPDEPGCGRLTFSPFIHAQNYIKPTENPEEGGYSCLKPGAIIEDLTQAPTLSGETLDLTRYPCHRGFEDITILCSDPKQELAFSAVAFPKQRFVWFSLKDPKVLASTLLWQSNGGRHMAPWNGRHVNVLGIEEITGFFHEGLAAGARANALSRRGIATHVKLNARKPTSVNYIFGVAALPARFDRVKRIEIEDDAHIVLLGSGKTRVRAAVDLPWLKRGAQ